MIKYIQLGDTINIPVEDVVPVGVLKIFGNLVGITFNPMSDKNLCVLRTIGLFENVPKGTGALTLGQIVYAAIDGKIYNASDAGRVPCGYATADAASGDTACNIFLFPSVQPAGEAGG